MNRAVLLLAVGLTAVLLFGAVAPAYAQEEISVVNVPFSFTVDNKVMPAGRYELSVTDQGVITLFPPKGAPMAVAIITRLAAPKSELDARLVFDKVENTYFLSEAWFPPRDGFMIRDTRQPHSHEVVKGQKKGT